MSEIKKGPQMENILPKELLDVIKDRILLDQIGKEPKYFFDLLKMDKQVLENEITRLTESTRHYSNASGDDLDWHWPPSAKRAASENLSRLHLAQSVLEKFDKFQNYREQNETFPQKPNSANN